MVDYPVYNRNDRLLSLLLLAFSGQIHNIHITTLMGHVLACYVLTIMDINPETTNL